MKKDIAANSAKVKSVSGEAPKRDPLGIFLRRRLVVARFVTTLGDWCGAALDSGGESADGGEWVVGDLENSPGKSLCIDLSSGKWQDFASEGRDQGGPEQLWAAKFGVDPKDSEKVLSGMEAWLKDGVLPDGTELGTQPEREMGRVRRKPELPWYLKHSPEMAERWRASVEDSKRLTDGFAREMAEYRGLSSEVFAFLIEEGYLAWFECERRTKDGTRTWTSGDIAFPVTFSTEEKSYFFGVYLRLPRWTTSGPPWLYYPKGTPGMPLVLGAPVSKAERIVIGESTWDVIAALDLYRMWESPVKWAAIATRGAKNLVYLPLVLRSISPDARVKILWQNDPAGRGFIARLPKKLCARARHIRPPAEIKDLNDWIKAEGRERVLERLRDVKSNG